MVVTVFKKLTMFMLVIGSGLLLSSCGSPEPIKIGFAGELTGKQAERGVGGRNAVQLAIDEVNAAGGINGRSLQLISKDDQGDPVTAQQVDAELVEAGVVAIIGHMTSGQTAAVFEQMNDAKMVLFSPGASSTRFSNQDDYFFRVQVATDVKGIALAQYAYQTLKQPQISVIYDSDNQAYSETLYDAFVGKYEALGGGVVDLFTFSSDETALNAFTQEVMATQPSALLFIASPVDTALISQYINSHAGEKPVLLSSSWAHSNELLAKGGQAVEGVHLMVTFDLDNPNPAFQEFVQKFEERYGRKPNGMAIYSYETMQVLAEALKKTGGKAEGLPKALLDIKEFPVIQGNLSLNEYGDIERDMYIAIVEEGQYKIIETVSDN